MRILKFDRKSGLRPPAGQIAAQTLVEIKNAVTPVAGAVRFQKTTEKYKRNASGFLLFNKICMILFKKLKNGYHSNDIRDCVGYGASQKMHGNLQMPDFGLVIRGWRWNFGMRLARIAAFGTCRAGMLENEWTAVEKNAGFRRALRLQAARRRIWRRTGRKL